MWYLFIILTFIQPSSNKTPPTLRVDPRQWRIPIDRPVGSHTARVYIINHSGENQENVNITLEPPSVKYGSFLDGSNNFKITQISSADKKTSSYEISLKKPLYGNFQVNDEMLLSVKVHSAGVSLTNEVHVIVEPAINPNFGVNDLTTEKLSTTTLVQSTTEQTKIKLTTEAPAPKETSIYVFVVIVPLIGLPILALSAYLMRKKKMKICLFCKKTNEQEINKTEAEHTLSSKTEMTDIQSSRKTSLAVTNSYDSDLLDTKEWISTDPWEIPRHHLKIFGILGEGCFGQVWKGEGVNILGNKGSLTVAIKTLKESAAEKEKKDLLQELAVMKMLDPHPNVVKLLGCCTEKDPVFVVMEYVAKGKLQDFLRKSRAEHYYGNLHGASQKLTSRDLTAFCLQVAKGMDYLSSKKVIHRDLAARNVLVTDQNICKVSDFGFSRDVMINNIYERKSEGRLPIRWMAPESLFDNIYTTKTDVWSFGILMWEIVTLGSTPYPGMSGSEVMKKVKEGTRLEKPEHCDREMYNQMYYCWDSDPKERPTFSQLVQEFESLLMQGTDYIDLNQFPDHAYYNEVSLSGEMV